MATSKTKLVTMTVTVKCPKWLSTASARREVRALINDQAFWGTGSPPGPDCEWDQIGSHNFRAVKVQP